MTNVRHIVCGGLRSMKRCGAREPLRLDMRGSSPNVTLSVSDLTRNLLANVPSAFLDLIEIATYVYVADQVIKRGTYRIDQLFTGWRRELVFDIPVRHPDLWQSQPVLEALTTTLSFLSEDVYEFRFHGYETPPLAEHYFAFKKGREASPVRVVPFSGGLDSLGGAIEEITSHAEQICLLTHEPTTKLRPRQELLRDHLVQRASGSAPLNIAVKVNKRDKRSTVEYTQRTRSFLYASLAATVAKMAGLPGIRFYENGVISINLPLAADVIGARASRTTHPRVLNGLQRLFTRISGEDFTIDNGFLWKTKTEVVQGILDAGFGDLIASSNSCTHTWAWKKNCTHCGHCSQCIDRRFAMLAAGAEMLDPSNMYGVDLVLGAQPDADSHRLLTSYVDTAQRVATMPLGQFREAFGEIYRTVRELPGRPADSVERIYHLYQRHGRAVESVLERIVSDNRRLIARGQTPANSLLQLVHDMSIPGEGAITTAAPMPVGDEPKFFFRREGPAWRYRFDGGESKILLPSIGASYLHVLLSSPGKEIWIGDLVAEVLGALPPLDPGEEVIDREGERKLWIQYREYQQLIESAEEHGDEGQASLLRNEQAEVLAKLLSAGHKTKRKRIGDATERLRSAVYAAIRRLRDDVGPRDAPFATHLQRYVRTGRTPCYQPPDGVIWVTS